MAKYSNYKLAFLNSSCSMGDTELVLDKYQHLIPVGQRQAQSHTAY